MNIPDKIMLKPRWPKGNRTTAYVLVTVFNEDNREYRKRSGQMTALLREVGIPTEISLDQKWSLGRQMKYANECGVPVVIIIGENELADGTVKVKDMFTGEEKIVKPLEMPFMVQSMVNRTPYHPERPRITANIYDGSIELHRVSDDKTVVVPLDETIDAILKLLNE